MAEPFLGQIMFAGFDFPPKGYALCNGQLLSITQNQALFSLVGTTYGGDGRVTFGLPNLQGATPVAFGPSADPQWQPAPYPLGALDGSQNVTLTSVQIPMHGHAGQGTSADGNQYNPRDTVYATNSAPIYSPAGSAQVTLAPPTVAPAGGGHAHDNMQPYLAINACIALVGSYPSRN